MRKLSSRPAGSSDAEGILAVGLARHIADLGAPDWTIDGVREELAPSPERFAAELSLVAQAGGSLVGVALCERWEDEDEGFVGFLAVAQRWRGRGLGRALLLSALDRMRAAGLARASLGVSGSNEAATALYRSVGMRVEWREDRYEKRLP